MKRVCSYCNKSLGTKISDTEATITHGICRECNQWVRRNWQQSMYDYLNSFNFPILLVDSGGIVKTANKSAENLLGKKTSEITGQYGGNATECEFARMPEGCGRTIHCTACTIRNTVTETFKTGIPSKDVSAIQSIYTPEDVQKIHFKISTEKMDENVLLKIDFAD